LPSSQTVNVLAAASPHAPVAGSQALLAQALSEAAEQMTTVLGLTMQLNGFWVLSQNSVPLQASPSSLAAQSPSTSHTHVFVPAVHSPCLHSSPIVHGLPSLHNLKPDTNFIAHLPVI
jgi:hypothetical protein